MGLTERGEVTRGGEETSTVIKQEIQKAGIKIKTPGDKYKQKFKDGINRV